MKIAITEVTDPKDAILALGVKTFLSQLGIGTGMQADFSGALFTKRFTAVAPKAAAAPKKAVARKAVVKPATTSDEKPRVTIRSQILDCLRRRPQTAHEVSLALGLGEGVNIPQHLYLIGRDHLATRDNDTNVWTLVA